ncbi:MAG: LPXTG cell wall anchor domain-containing protein [Lachnospiraceae bacterium]
MKILKNKLTIALSAFLCLAMLWGNGMVSYAAGETVTITSVSGTTTTVTVAGTTDASAVMVQIRDASGTTILAMQSFGTLSDNFSGSITGLSLTAGATYTVYVADYEGGPWATSTVTPVQAAPGGGGTGSGGTGSGETGTTAVTTPSATPTDPTPTEDHDNNDTGVTLNPDDTADQDPGQLDTVPQTGDEGSITIWFALLLISGLGVVFMRKKVN